MSDNPNNNLLLWEKAAPMSNADLQFAPKELRERWTSANETSAMDIFKSKVEDAIKGEARGMAVFTKVLEGPQKIWSEQRKIRDTCRELLLGHIKTGALRSFAFGAPRTVDASPVELTPRNWTGFLNWDHGKISHESLEFVEVRLISSRRSLTLLGAQIETVITEGSRPNVGRPSVKQDIEKAFNALFEAGKFDLDAPVKSQCQIIRNWLVHFVPDGGFGPDKPKYDAIRRHLKPLVEQAKQTE